MHISLQRGKSVQSACLQPGDSELESSAHLPSWSFCPPPESIGVLTR